MKVIAYDPYLSVERAKDIGVEKVELDDLYARADFITLHTPQTETTKHMINKDSIAKMKDGVRIINCARGGLIVQDDLVAALDSGKVGGAALDVFASEPAKKSPFFGRENVVCTPHLGASTNEAQENVALQVAEQMADYLVSGAVTNALNMASVSAEDAPRLKPYMKLMEQLGGLIGQVIQSAPTEIAITYAGHVTEINTKPLTAVVLEGLLRPSMDSVNMVNAPAIAKERDIQVVESTNSECKDYHTLVRLSVKTEHQTRTVSGTLFGGDKPRIVEFNGVPIEAEISKDMLFIRNQDKPGFIGALGSALGQAGINIASFHLGRAEPGKDALALLQTDQTVDAATLEAVRALPHVTQAMALRF